MHLPLDSDRCRGRRPTTSRRPGDRALCAVASDPYRRAGDPAGASRDTGGARTTVARTPRLRTDPGSDAQPARRRLRGYPRGVPPVQPGTHPLLPLGDANRVAVDGSHTQREAAAQMGLLPRARGPRAHAQLIGGEVSLLPPEDHFATLQIMRAHGREPMSMSHGDYDYDYLTALTLDRDGRRRLNGLLHGSLRQAHVRPPRHRATTRPGIAPSVPQRLRRDVRPPRARARRPQLPGAQHDRDADERRAARVSNGYLIALDRGPVWLADDAVVTSDGDWGVRGVRLLGYAQARCGALRFVVPVFESRRIDAARIVGLRPVEHRWHRALDAASRAEASEFPKRPRGRGRWSPSRGALECISIEMLSPAKVQKGECKLELPLTRVRLSPRRAAGRPTSPTLTLARQGGCADERVTAVGALSTVAGRRSGR